MQHGKPPSQDSIAIFADVLWDRYGYEAHPFAMEQLSRLKSEDERVIAIWLRILERLGSITDAADDRSSASTSGLAFEHARPVRARPGGLVGNG